MPVLHSQVFLVVLCRFCIHRCFGWSVLHSQVFLEVSPMPLLHPHVFIEVSLMPLLHSLVFFCGQSYVMSKSQVLGGHSYARSSFTGVCLVVSLMPVLHSQVFLWPVLCQFYIHRYTFTLDPKYPVKKKLAAIMRTESGMRMFATPRTPSL